MEIPVYVNFHTVAVLGHCYDSQQLEMGFQAIIFSHPWATGGICMLRGCWLNLETGIFANHDNNRIHE